jgi:hypothetical protein
MDISPNLSLLLSIWLLGCQDFRRLQPEVTRQSREISLAIYEFLMKAAALSRFLLSWNWYAFSLAQTAAKGAGGMSQALRH